MAITSTYFPASPAPLGVGSEPFINVQIRWQNGVDVPLTVADTLTFNLKDQQPIPTGEIKPRLVATMFPVTIAPTISNGTSSAMYRLPLSAELIGRVTLTLQLNRQQAPLLPDYEFIVEPTNYTVTSSGFSQRAIPIATVDTLDTTAPDNLKSMLVVTAMSTDATPVPVAGAQVIFTISNVAPEASQAGNFFDMTSGSPVKINMQGSTSGGMASFSLRTNASGTVNVVVVSNTNPGFIFCEIAGRNNNSTVEPPARLYIFKDQLPGQPGDFRNPRAVLPFGSTTTFNTTNYSKQTFPINIADNKIVQTEFCVAILNGKYQEDQPTAIFDNGSTSYNGKTSDLNVSRAGANNVLFYAVSDNGRLRNSQAVPFSVLDTKPGPVQGIQFGPFNAPRSSHLDLKDVNPLVTIIPLGTDQEKLAAANNSPLVMPNSYVVHAIVTGWNVFNDFETRTQTYPQTIDDFTAATVTKNIDALPDFEGLGRSPDGVTRATWELWYTYHTGANGTGIRSESRNTPPAP